MIGRPDTRYANRDGVHLAYQVAGRGPAPIVYVAGSWSCSLGWEEPIYSRQLARLASFSRLVTFDQRGVGLSDPIDASRLPTVEDRVGDLAAVVSAAEVVVPAVFGTHDGGAVAALYAATHPVSHLILCNTWARLAQAPDFPIGFPDQVLDRMEDRYREAWGSGAVAYLYAPTVEGRQAPGERVWARHERGVASPSQAVALFRTVRELDIRDILASIKVPTLVIHLGDNVMVPPVHGRYLADHIPGARHVEVPGSDQAFLRAFAPPVFDEVEEFVTGARSAQPSDRTVATILFTDIVNSTRRAAEVGDQQWGDLLDEHHRRVRWEIERFSGREIKPTGDGFLAGFDGPVQAIRCACSARDAVAPLDLELRAGLHVGEVRLLDDGDIAGLAVHIAERVSALAAPGEVFVTSTAKSLAAGSDITFHDRGSHELRGVPGMWQLFRARV